MGGGIDAGDCDNGVDVVDDDDVVSFSSSSHPHISLLLCSLFVVFFVGMLVGGVLVVKMGVGGVVDGVGVIVEGVGVMVEGVEMVVEGVGVIGVELCGGLEYTVLLGFAFDFVGGALLLLLLT